MQPSRAWVFPLCSCQTEPARKALWETEQLEGELTSRFGASIASEPFLPTETVMRPLGKGEDHLRGGGEAAVGGDRLIGSALVSHKLYAGPPMLSAARVAPEQRSRTHQERMQQYADLARLCRRSTIPLTRLSQWTGTTTANTGYLL